MPENEITKHSSGGESFFWQFGRFFWQLYAFYLAPERNGTTPATHVDGDGDGHGDGDGSPNNEDSDDDGDWCHGLGWASLPRNFGHQINGGLRTPRK